MVGGMRSVLAAGVGGAAVRELATGLRVVVRVAVQGAGAAGCRAAASTGTEPGGSLPKLATSPISTVFSYRRRAPERTGRRS